MLFLILAAQCQSHHPSINSVVYDKFKKAYIQLIQEPGLQNYSSDVAPDSVLAVLDRIHLTQNEYHQMMSYLNEKPERWYVFLQEVLKEIESDKKKSVPVHNPLISDVSGVK